ncbi:hypothetical protein H2198_001668 [Neophaeococcomyces mojaviensis]|uniref:Uncharacterized protein n=1 Tax=Neophaeococcomyces mojaviensis TaxID=3383035 RepID=A0ACC3AGS0_9EURO|nr:hypothetical protein H2198_001668 [Knufia sp. JES_112]
MAAMTSNLSEATQSRVEDYLNDKFQNVADLENIDNLLTKLHEQQNLLRKQLADAQDGLRKADKELEENVEDLRNRAIKNERQQAETIRMLQIITQSEVSDDAVKMLDVPMQKQRRIEVAMGYVKTLQNVEYLEQTARKSLESSPGQAIEAYKSIQSLLYGLEIARPATDEGAPHLFDQVSTISTKLYEDVKNNLETKLQKTLDNMKWPKKEVNLLGRNVEDWSTYTELLLGLQEPCLLGRDPDILSQTPQEPIILLPLVVMVHPLALRFRYHFYGDKPTNRLDKPEYFFSHFLDVLEQHHLLMTDLLQPILDERVRKDDRLDLVYTDAVSSFITALLPMVAAKCLSLLPQLTSQPQLMSHFIHEMMSFDTTLQQSWAYSPFAGPLRDWKGLTWDMLTKHGFFTAWLSVEKDFALSRYRRIRDAPESNSIDYDGVEEGRTKPTKGAIRVNDLLETITDRYRQLSSFTQKLRFLMDIQLSIFDDYHNHLYGVLQAYLVGSHTAGRYLQGQSAEDAMGLRGLETLAKVFGSAEYLERKMGDWSDDVFFLELWEELQDRASRNTGANGTVGRDLSVEEVAAKTSGTIRNADEILESEGGALFDETENSYRRLRERSEGEIVRALDVNVRNAIRPFLEVSIWASISATITDITQMAPSSALDSLNNTISTLLGFLASVLAPGPLRRITRHVCATIQKEIYDKLLLKHNFSAAGAIQLKRDVIAISDAINTSTKLPNEAGRHLRRLNDALVLLSLPIKASKKAAAEDNADDWGFGDDEPTPEEEQVNVTAEEQEDWGLWQAEKTIFADNASARNALESMGLTELSEADARNIIRRRIEVNS